MHLFVCVCVRVTHMGMRGHFGTHDPLNFILKVYLFLFIYVSACTYVYVTVSMSGAQ